MEAGTTVAATPVYVLSSQILVPICVAGCPLSHSSPECNVVDEPACNPCCELLIRHGVFAPVLLPHHTATVFVCRPHLLSKPEFLGLSALPVHFQSLHGSQPTTKELAASSRAGLPVAVMIVTSAVTTTTSSLAGMVGSGAPARAPRSARGCLYRGGHWLISAALGKAAF